ncbi:MAG: hypothetical protein ACO23R_02635 [bacterium]
MSETLTIKAYHNQKTAAKRRGIEFNIAFRDWKKWWIDTGKADGRGRDKGCYQMCRFNDEGAYDLENIYCATIAENMRHKQRGKALPERTKIKVSQAMTGRKLSKSHIANITGKNNGHAKKTITPLGIFDTATEAAKAHKVSNATITLRVQDKSKPEYYYSTDAMEHQQCLNIA